MALTKRFCCLFSATLILGIGFLFTPSVEATHWSHNVSFSPLYAYQGNNTRFIFQLTNTASGWLTVYWARISLCWLSDPIYLKNNDGTPLWIGASQSYSFNQNIKVSQSWFGACPATISVYGNATGDFLREQVDYQYSVDIIQVTFDARISANPYFGKAPITVSFASNVYESGLVSNYTYQWSFGDGGISILANPSHTYQSAGPYNVTLTVTDSRNVQTYDAIMLTVSPKAISPIAILLAALPIPIILLKRRTPRMLP